MNIWDRPIDSVLKTEKEKKLARWSEKFKKMIQIYPKIYKIYKIYKVNTKYQAAAGPAQAKGRAGPFVYLVYLVYLWIYLDHFFEFFGIFRPCSVVHWSESDTPIWRERERVTFIDV